MDPLDRFSNRAADYARYRPSYPAAAIDFILAGLGDAKLLHGADIGAGTGISSRLLAERGMHVVAIEPNEEMLAAAQAHPLVVYRDGSGEQTALGDASVDLVTCFQSYHWLKRDVAIAEFQRILRPAGRVAVAWNIADNRDALSAAYDFAIEKAAGKVPCAQRDSAGDELIASPPFRNGAKQVFTHRHRVDLEAFLGRARSSSHLALEGAAFETCLRELTALHARHADAGGMVELAYETEVYRAELA
jgi:SAM-dependent methyltransferase